MKTLFSVRNLTGEDWPAFAMGRLGTRLLYDGKSSDVPLYNLVKPDGGDGIYIVNGRGILLDEKQGTATYYQDARYVLVKDDSAFPQGKAIGAVSGQWEAGDTGKQHFNTLDAKNDDHIVPVVTLSGGSTTTSGSGGGCACYCVSQGDIVVGGIETTKKKQIFFPNDVKMNRSAYGHVYLPFGYYEVVYDAGEGKWIADVGGQIVAVYNDGSPATEFTTIEAELTFEFPGSPRPKTTLQVTAYVGPPEPPPPPP